MPVSAQSAKRQDREEGSEPTASADVTPRESPSVGGGAHQLDSAPIMSNGVETHGVHSSQYSASNSVGQETAGVDVQGDLVPRWEALIAARSEADEQTGAGTLEDDPAVELDKRVDAEPLLDAVNEAPDSLQEETLAGLASTIEDKAKIVTGAKRTVAEIAKDMEQSGPSRSTSDEDLHPSQRSPDAAEVRADTTHLNAVGNRVSNVDVMGQMVPHWDGQSRPDEEPKHKTPIVNEKALDTVENTGGVTATALDLPDKFGDTRRAYTEWIKAELHQQGDVGSSDPMPELDDPFSEPVASASGTPASEPQVDGAAAGTADPAPDLFDEGGALAMVGGIAKTVHGAKKFRKGLGEQREGARLGDRSQELLGRDLEEEGADSMLSGGSATYAGAVGVGAAAAGASAAIVGGPSAAVAGFVTAGLEAKEARKAGQQARGLRNVQVPAAANQGVETPHAQALQQFKDAAGTRSTDKSWRRTEKSAAAGLAGSGAAIGTAGAIMSSVAVAGTAAAATAATVVLSGGIVAGVAAGMALGLGLYKMGRFMYKYGKSSDGSNFRVEAKKRQKEAKADRAKMINGLLTVLTSETSTDAEKSAAEQLLASISLKVSDVIDGGIPRKKAVDLIDNRIKSW